MNINTLRSKVILDLTTKGYQVFIPINEQDYGCSLVAQGRNGKLYGVRLSKNMEPDYAVRCDGSEFQYYAIHLPEQDKVIYPHVKFSSEIIYTYPPTPMDKPVFWFEDFLDFTDDAPRRKIQDTSLGEHLKKLITNKPDPNDLTKFLVSAGDTELTERYTEVWKILLA